ncbi:MAG: aldehyde dehydrogenase family protein [Opitutales bacterium]|nr:aldehyde dehydrogenase family protein [Opitutales bacterium]
MPASFQFASPGDLRITLDRVEHTAVEPVIAAAAAAYRNWAHTPVSRRLELLQAVEAGLKEAAEELAMGIALEVGKPLTEARGEMGAVVGKFALTFKDAEEYLYPRKIEGGPFEAEIRQIPRGPAVVIGPFNFPLHLANGAIVPHLLAGNPVIFKPSPIGAVVGAKYAAIFQKHLPEGVFGLVQGQAVEGTALCTDPRILNICFTGSVDVGRSIAQAVAGDFSKSVALEMGGKNALILLEDGDAAAAAKAAVDGICATAGQRCNDTSRAIIHRSHVNAFCKGIKEAFKHYVPGDPCKAETTLGVLVNEAAHKRYAEHLASGGEWIVEGAAMNTYEGRPGYYVKPAARIWRTAAEGLKCPIIDKEIFAPLLDIFVTESDAEMLTLHNAAPFGLAASIYTSSRERFETIGSDLDVGNLYANIPTTFSPSILPFGGCGLSGNGKPAGRGFIRYTTDEQAVQFGQGI